MAFACVTPTDTPPLYSRRQCGAQDRAASVATGAEGAWDVHRSHQGL